MSSQPQDPWQEVAMDIKGFFLKKPQQRGNRYILVVVDMITRTAEMILITDKSAKTVACALVHQVFCRRRIPESILTVATNLATRLYTRLLKNLILTRNVYLLSTLKPMALFRDLTVPLPKC